MNTCEAPPTDYRHEAGDARGCNARAPSSHRARAKPSTDQDRRKRLSTVKRSAPLTQDARDGDRAANSFESVARVRFAKYAPKWAASHSEKIIRRLEMDVFPWIGGDPIAEITAPAVLKVLRRIEGRGALDTAHKAPQNCGQIFRHGVATGRLARDPITDLRGALPPARHIHFSSITDPAQVGELLRAIDGFRGTFVVQCALRLAPLFFVRPGELRKALWKEVDLDTGQWRYLVTKTRTEHLVPLRVIAVHDLQHRRYQHRLCSQLAKRSGMGSDSTHWRTGTRGMT